MTEPKKESGRFVMLLLELRGKRTQIQFADWMGIKRAHISNAERGSPPGPTLRRALVKRFPRRTEEIASTIAEDFPKSGAEPKREPGRSPETAMLKRARGLVLHGRPREAVQALLAGVQELSDPEELIRCYRLLGDAQYVLAERDDAYRSWNTALDISIEHSELELEEMLRNRIAGHLGREDRFEEALRVVDEGLARYVQSGKLWRRRGIVCWLAHDFAPAYSSLTTALEFGCPRQRAIHTRGQVLVEWGYFEEGIEELDEVISLADTPLATAYARNTRAFALGHIGRLEEAFREFNDIEELEPNSGWLHYFRARCLELAGDTGGAIASYQQAIECSSPPLNAPKRVFATGRVTYLSCL